MATAQPHVDRICYEAIVAAAQLGAPPPTNESMAIAAGVSHRASVIRAIHRLENTGKILVMRLPGGRRQIEVVGLGLTTGVTLHRVGNAPQRPTEQLNDGWLKNRVKTMNSPGGAVGFDGPALPGGCRFIVHDDYLERLRRNEDIYCSGRRIEVEKNGEITRSSYCAEHYQRCYVNSRIFPIAGMSRREKRKFLELRREGKSVEEAIAQVMGAAA